MTSTDDQWAEIRERAQDIQESISKGIHKLASLGTEGLTEAELQKRLQVIAKLLVYRDGARDILVDRLAGKIEAEEAEHVLETIRYQAVSLWGGEDKED